MTLAFMAAATIRTSLLLAAALAATYLLRGRSAALRHAVLATAIVGSLAIPALGLLLPAWGIAIPASAAADVATPANGAGASGVSTTIAFGDLGQTDGSTARAERRGAELPAASFVAWCWAIGAALGLVGLLAGLGRLWWLSGTATRVTSGPWVDWLRERQHDTRLARVRVLQSNHPALLLTWGYRRPCIVLPAGAQAWAPGRVHVVMEHEAEHIRRGDWLLQLAAETLRWAWWFNPLAWSAANRLRLEGERACDDRVIARGVAASDYAEHLVCLARTLTTPRLPLPAPAMARASSLERRVTAMLDPQVTRRPLTRLLRLTIVAVGLALTISIATFAQSKFATVSGTVHDQLGGTIPKVTLSLTHTESGAKHEIKSNETGAFEFVGLPAGNYSLETTAMGFQSMKASMQLAAGQVRRQDVTLQVGTLQETITIRDGPPSPITGRQRQFSPSASSGCSTEPNSGGIKPPTKIHDVRPIYPSSMRGTDTEGKVELDAVIGLDGAIKTVQTADATNRDFADAAEEAVRQWRFTPTLLNCVPIEVSMKVTTAFRPLSAAPPPPPPAPPAPPQSAVPPAPPVPTQPEAAPQPAVQPQPQPQPLPLPR